MGARWLPGAFAAAFAVAAVLRYGVSAVEVARFTAYAGLGIAAPGVLWVRALHRGGRTAAEEIALGLTCGYATEVFAYIGARALGAPLLVAGWPVATYVLFLAVPGLRRHWRSGRGRSAPPVWYSWSLALAFAYLTAWGAVTYFRPNPLTWPDLGRFVSDLPFHLALAGELKHHVPPSLPMVAGEPLLYHWFVYAHLAAASWVSGLEPLVLLARLAVLPMLAALVVLIGMTARRVTGLWAAASLSVAGAVLVALPSLYLGSNGSFTWGGIPDLAWTSPTQTFGAVLFAALVVLLVDTRRNPRHREAWALAALLLLAVMGAKATYLPLLAAGLVTVAVTETLRRGRPSRHALAMLALTGGCLLYAQFVLFGGARQAVVVAPLYTVRASWQELTGRGQLASPSPGSLWAMTGVWLLGWLVTWSGTAGLLIRPRSPLRPPLALMLGMGAAGLGTALLLGHPNRSHLFFLWGAYPYLVIASVCGLVAAVRRARQPRRVTAAAACAGVAAAYVVPALCGVRVPLGPGRPDAALVTPYLVLAALTVLTAVVVARMRGRRRGTAVALVMLAGAGLLADAHGFVLGHLPGRGGSGGAVAAERAQSVPPDVPAGAMAAGRWLRDHSAPGDLVATNAHCLRGTESHCDSRHFWVSALSERRVLVEGWAFSERSEGAWRPDRPATVLPFWDGRKMAANEAAFTTPSAAAIGLLRDRYGVRWLVADERLTGPGTSIGRFAGLRFRSGDWAVYRVPGGGGH
ncbi:hypothetical protein F5972_17960 [Microbispora cellulosiformans]|uniref:Uncharacterized protein n=1 Tax=Microbispora cellulosiformans TaxID=2614688 RepID=A0A5J5K052_9ACTN|nr:hypothetical protein [Microbispora cellulosiformans]KAA9377522.1 hypothetical protein F5972_17960 [Microbispora cellulosiformans]